ncbi:hypothetical protein ABZ777_03950 [Micromonospora parva]|uniref:hypothetical protein n=1 Tax=Micromonospora parva TaxID=1464048 RepID=UPI0033FBE359
MVLDGATARTDTGCRHGVSWYAARLGAAVSALAVDPETTLASALSQAIEAVAKQHPECDLTSPGTPSAAVALLRADETEVEFLALGDVTIVLDGTSGLQVITDERVDQTAKKQRRNADRFPIGSKEKQAALIEMKHAELAARNQPGGFWVAAADPSVAQHAITGSARLANLRQCAVLTDGAARIVRMFELLDWHGLLRLLNQEGPHELLRRVREVEQHDPVGARWPRNKRSDDATVVLVRSSAESQLDG